MIWIDERPCNSLKYELEYNDVAYDDVDKDLNSVSSYKFWKDKSNDIENPKLNTQMKDYIKQYVASKFANNKIKVTKDGNKYTAKYLIPNKVYNDDAYREYKRDLEETVMVTIILSLLIGILGFLFMIPNILGVIAFTIINLVIVCLYFTRCTYEGIVQGTIWLCVTFIIIFISHFILLGQIDGPDDTYAIACSKAFHTIYPEYLFKFKF